MPKPNTQPVLPITFSKPPAQYDQDYMRRLIGVLEDMVRRYEQPRYLQVTGMIMLDPPTTTTGLKSGEVYSDGGVLKLVP